MRYERVGFSLVGALAAVAVIVTIAIVWLFLTDPIAVATDVGDGDVSPFIRDLTAVVLRALQGLLKYL